MTAAERIFDADVVVVGAGPAGWAMASALGRVGVSAMVVASDPSQRWPATYGMWVDEFPSWIADGGGGFGSVFGHEWPEVRVAGTVETRLPRRYGRLDNDALRRALGSVNTFAASVRGATHHAWGSRVHTSAGNLETRQVIDATGAAGVLTVPRPADAAQVAYGLVVPSGALPEAWRTGGACTLMDWRPVGSDVPDGPGDATFLYVLDDGQRALVEETSLVRRPPRTPDELRVRLARRLGADLTSDALDVEVVHIPMASGRRRHQRHDRVVAFGASAGYVHPATGYSVTASLRSAPRVAAAVASTLAMDDRQRAAALVADAVWPVAQRRVRALHDVGLAALERLDGEGLRRFFDAFFELPTEQWSAYLQVHAEPGAITQTMTGVFRRLPWRYRRVLMSARPAGLLAALVPGGS